jgi:prophage maintenance system killer protein
VSKAVADLAAFNLEVETQVKARFVTEQNTRMETFLSNGGYAFAASVNAFDQDVAALNGQISDKAESDYVTAASSALESFLSSNNYNSYVTGASVITTTPDLTALNAGIKAQVEDNYVADQNARMDSWQSSNGYTYLTGVAAMTTADIGNAGYLTSLNAGIESQVESKYVAEQNARMDSWQSSNGYTYLTGVGAMAMSDIGRASYLSNLNAGWATAVEAKWKAGISADLTAFMSSNGLDSLAPDADVAAAIADAAAFNVEVKARAVAAFLQSSGPAAEGVTAAAFNAGAGFNYSAWTSTYSGAAYSAPPDFAVVPSAFSFAAFAFDAAYPAFTGFTLGGAVHVERSCDP